MGKIKIDKEFKQVAILIEEARDRAFQKVNEELVLLYFKVGNIVSEKVAAGHGVIIQLQNWPVIFKKTIRVLVVLHEEACIE